MKRRIEIRSRVCDHFDFADLEFSPRRVAGAGSLATEVIANDRRGQAFISYHPVFDDVAQVDEVSLRHPAKVAQPSWRWGRRASCLSTLLTTGWKPVGPTGGTPVLRYEPK